MKMEESDIMLYLINHGCGNNKFKERAFIMACELGKLNMTKELVEQHNVTPKGNHRGVIMLGISVVRCSTYCQMLLINNFCIPSQM